MKNIFPDNTEEAINKIEKIHFIKLGKKGGLDKTLLDRDVGDIAISFREVDVIQDDNETIKRKYELEKRSAGTVTTFVNQINKFRKANETVLWITFSNQKLWWGITDNKEPYRDDSFPEGYTQYTSKKLKFGWYDHDIDGNELTYENIAGVLLAVQGYRGTICDIEKKHNFDTFQYVIRKIKGEKLEEWNKADSLRQEFESAIIEVIKLLQPKDFEYFVDLIFMRSGWIKQTPGGGVEKDIDLDLVQPLTGERVFIQIKSSATQKVFNDYYLDKYKKHDIYSKFIFVYHSSAKEIISDELDAIIMDNQKLAELAVELGLANFLLKKVS